jgi:hypothetical protein
MVRDWVQDGMAKKGGLDLLYAIPRNGKERVSYGGPVGAVGAEWVSSACVGVALTKESYTTRTFMRGRNQSLNCSILGGNHSMPAVPGKQFQERWTSLSGGTVQDDTWDQFLWLDYWLTTVPEFEWNLLQEMFPSFMKTYPQVKPARCNH